VIPVLTKADKLKQGERHRQLKHAVGALAPFAVNPGDFIWFSAPTREGKNRLWECIVAALKSSNPAP
jgi:GTP-binding protein EngB required for normal cell division